MGIVASVIGMGFFSAMFQVLDWSFLVLHFFENFCNWIPKLIWPRADWFWIFCWKLASLVDFISVRTKICYICSYFFLFWSLQIFSVFSLRGILVCSLKLLVLFSHRILYYWSLSFRKAMNFLLSVFSVFQSIFLGSSGKTLWLLLKTKYSVFQVLC